MLQLDASVLAQIGVVGLVGFLARVWLVGELSRLDRTIRDNAEKLEDRVTRTEKEVSSVPAALQKVSTEMQEALRRIELQIATNHPTKREMAESFGDRNQRLEHIERDLRQLTHVTTQILARLDPRLQYQQDSPSLGAR